MLREIAGRRQESLSLVPAGTWAPAALADAPRRLRDDDGLSTRRTIDLCAGIPGIALNMLVALGTGKLEIGHKFFPSMIFWADLSQDEPPAFAFKNLFCFFFSSRVSLNRHAHY